MDGGDGNARSLGQVSLGEVHHQPVILEPQPEHLQDPGVRLLLLYHISVYWCISEQILSCLESLALLLKKKTGPAGISMLSAVIQDTAHNYPY